MEGQGIMVQGTSREDPSHVTVQEVNIHLPGTEGAIVEVAVAAAAAATDVKGVNIGAIMALERCNSSDALPLGIL